MMRLRRGKVARARLPAKRHFGDGGAVRERSPATARHVRRDRVYRGRPRVPRSCRSRAKRDGRRRSIPRARPETTTKSGFAQIAREPFAKRSPAIEALREPTIAMQGFASVAISPRTARSGGASSVSRSSAGYSVSPSPAYAHAEARGRRKFRARRRSRLTTFSAPRPPRRARSGRCSIARFAPPNWLMRCGRCAGRHFPCGSVAANRSAVRRKGERGGSRSFCAPIFGSVPLNSRAILARCLNQTSAVRRTNRSAAAGLPNQNKTSGVARHAINPASDE